MLRVELLKKNTLKKYDKLIHEFGEHVMYSEYSTKHGDDMIETFFFMSLQDKIRFNNDQFRDTYLGMFNNSFSYLGDHYSPTIVDIFTHRFQKNPVDRQIKIMTNHETLFNVVAQIKKTGLSQIIKTRLSQHRVTFI